MRYLKETLSIFAISFILTVAAEAQVSIGFCWDRSISPNVSRYKLYVSTKPNARANSIRAIESISNTVQVENLVQGALHHFAVTAITSEGLESDPSNEISYLVPRIQIVRPGVIQFWRPINRSNVDYVLETATEVTGPWTARTPLETILSTDLENNVELVQMETAAIYRSEFSRINLRINKIGCASEQAVINRSAGVVK